MKKNKVIIEYLPHGAHLCVGKQCGFRLATRVGDYIVSTVGEYFKNYPYPKEGEKMETIGYDRFYETMD